MDKHIIMEYEYLLGDYVRIYNTATHLFLRNSYLCSKRIKNNWEDLWYFFKVRSSYYYDSDDSEED